MKTIPPDLIPKYKALLNQNGITDNHQHLYLKWLRYYLDFCEKYKFDASNPQSLPNFLAKVKEKRQSEASQKQAQSAVHLYYVWGVSISLS